MWVLSMRVLQRLLRHGGAGEGDSQAKRAGQLVAGQVGDVNGRSHRWSKVGIGYFFTLYYFNSMRHRSDDDMSQPSSRLQQADRVGFASSMLCAIHCAAMPLLLAILPTFGLGIGGWVDIDQAVVVFATLLAGVTLTIGWRRHRGYRAWGLLMPALGLLWFSTFGPFHSHTGGVEAWLHAGMMVVGGLLLAAAHLTNMRLTHLSALDAG